MVKQKIQVLGNETINANDYLIAGPANGGDAKKMKVSDFTNYLVGSGGAVPQTDFSNLKTALTVHPSYVSPSAQLSSTQSQSGLEIGQTISIPLTVAFTQNDGGTLAGTSIKKDGTQISTANSFTDSVVLSATPKVYQATVSYNQGAVKNNNFSEADAVGRIPSGSVNSNSLSYRGYYKIFFGNSSSVPTNSAAVRALNSQLQTNNIISLQTGTTNRNQVLVYPATHYLGSVVDTSNNVNITDQFTVSNISVNDAAGNAVSYKIAFMTTSVSYPNDTLLSVNILPL